MFEPHTIFNAASWTRTKAEMPGSIPSWIAPDVGRPARERGRREALSPLTHDRQASRRTEPPSERPPPKAKPTSPPPLDVPPAQEAEAQESESEIVQLRHQLNEVLEQMAQMRRHVLEASERDVVRLSMAIAETVVGRELTVSPELVATWARAGIDHLVEEDQIELAIAGDVAEAVPADAWVDGAGNSVRPTVDSSLPPGSCELRGEFSRVDASAAARLAAVADGIGVSDEKER